MYYEEFFKYGDIPVTFGFFFQKIHFYVYFMWLSLCIHTHECRCLHRPEEGVGSFGAGVTGGEKPCHMGVGTKSRSSGRVAGTVKPWALFLAHINSSSLWCVTHSSKPSFGSHHSVLVTWTTLVFSRLLSVSVSVFSHLFTCWPCSALQECLSSLWSVFHRCPKIANNETQHKIINTLSIMNHFLQLIFVLDLVWYSKVNFVGNKVLLNKFLSWLLCCCCSDILTHT